MGFYVVSSYVLCTLVLLSVTDAGEYPGKNIFSGIYSHQCNILRYVCRGVSHCMKENVPSVPRPDKDVIFATSQVEAMVTEMCSAQDKVTDCVTTMLKDCSNKEEIMESYLGRYVICDGDKPRSWITQWVQSNSQAKLNRNCSSIFKRTMKEAITNCMLSEGMEDIDMRNITVTEGTRLLRKYITETFDCSVNVYKDHGSAIESDPECVDLDKWSNLIPMLALYLNSNRDVMYVGYLSEEDMTTVQLYATWL